METKVSEVQDNPMNARSAWDTGDLISQTKMKTKREQAWWHTPSIPALGSQKRGGGGLCDFEASLVCVERLSKKK